VIALFISALAPLMLSEAASVVVVTGLFPEGHVAIVYPLEFFFFLGFFFFLTVVFVIL
jgi:hypothetical protein